MGGLCNAFLTYKHGLLQSGEITAKTFGEADMLKAFHPRESWPSRKDRLGKLQAEWEQYSLPGDRGNSCQPCKERIQAFLRERHDLLAAVDDLLGGLEYHTDRSAKDGAFGLVWAAVIADERGVDLQAMAALVAGVMREAKRIGADRLQRRYPQTW